MISYNRIAKAESLIDKEKRQSLPDYKFIQYLKDKYNL